MAASALIVRPAPGRLVRRERAIADVDHYDIATLRDLGLLGTDHAVHSKILPGIRQ
jgi:hypothetical protein